MTEGRIAPSAIVIGEGVVGWTKVGCRDGDGVMQAPFGVVIALQLITSSAPLSVVEESCAESRRVCTVALAVQIPVPTCSSCNQIQIYFK